MGETNIYKTVVRRDFIIDMKFIAKVYGVEIKILNEDLHLCADGRRRIFCDVEVAGNNNSLSDFVEMWKHIKYSLLRNG